MLLRLRRLAVALTTSVAQGQMSELRQGYARARHNTLKAALVTGIIACACLGLRPGLAVQSEAAASETPGFADLVARVKPAVIAVTVRLDEDAQESTADEQEGPDRSHPFAPDSPLYRHFFGTPEKPQRPPANAIALALGSGFFISPDGYAVTNAHVVEHGASFKIATQDGTTYTAKVIGADLRTDLALLKVDGRNDFPSVQLADHEPRVGDWVIAVGNPYGLGGTVTAGIVSALGRHLDTDTYDDFIQIDAPINRGNSGGPSFDLKGEVVGVNTAIFSPSGGSVGIGFAIPSTTVKPVIEQLKQKGVVSRGSLGVEAQPLTPDVAAALGLKQPEGALITETQPEGAAAKAGIVPGDVVMSVDGQAVHSAHDLAARIGAMAPGTAARIGLRRRNGTDSTVSVTLGELPVTPFKPASMPAPPHRGSGLGVALAPAATVAGAGSNGMVITELDPSGPAAQNGLAPGDVILDIAGKAVNSNTEVHDALSDAEQSGRKDVLMRVRTANEGTRFVAVPIRPKHQTLWGEIRNWLHSL
jgi:serine protease Do